VNEGNVVAVEEVVVVGDVVVEWLDDEGEAAVEDD